MKHVRLIQKVAGGFCLEDERCRSDQEGETLQHLQERDHWASGRWVLLERKWEKPVSRPKQCQAHAYRRNNDREERECVSEVVGGIGSKGVKRKRQTEQQVLARPS